MKSMTTVLCVVMGLGVAQAEKRLASVRVGPYEAEIHTAYGTAEGLPSAMVRDVLVAPTGDVYAATDAGVARFDLRRWRRVEALADRSVEALAWGPTGLVAASGTSVIELDGDRVARTLALPSGPARDLAVADVTYYAALDTGLARSTGDAFVMDAGLAKRLGADTRVRQIALGPKGAIAVAAWSGVFLRDASTPWHALVPEEGARRWAVQDARGVAFDTQGRLWCASPQGAACLDDEWRLYTGYEGLPYDDFTAITAGRNGAVWFGTHIGAVHFDDGRWAYRQGRRWLLDDDVSAIAVSPDGDAWFATPAGVSRIERRVMTLAEKAAFFDDEIDRYHRRTPFGYVDTVHLAGPGDKSVVRQRDSDNDGLWTSMYGAGECFAYAATGSPDAKRRAQAVFKALHFLGTVTQGGEHPAPPGFVARTILPTSGHDPNEGRVERDRETRSKRDGYWKVYDPRWPVSEDGQWYWKSDTSSDELDGHYFFYAAYYDLVADTPDEKARVRAHVAALTDHLIDHGFNLVDWEGTPTRWARYSPEEMNRDPAWWMERGLNSLSMLSYLKTAEHVTGDAKYREAARGLIEDHGYAMNVMYPKAQYGPGSGNQSDDEMAFMSYYNLLKYETDPELRQIYAFSLHNYWRLEEPEMCPLFNFICAATITGDTFTDPWGTTDLTPRGPWLEESVDQLQRFPLDRVNWRHTNSHRKDLIRLAGYTREGGASGKGYRRSGRVLPVDERFFEHLNHDPWSLDTGGAGTGLADGAAFLLPYYMGLHHGFLVEAE